MIAVVGAVCDRAFLVPAESCGSGRREARSTDRAYNSGSFCFFELLDGPTIVKVVDVAVGMPRKPTSTIALASGVFVEMIRKLWKLLNF